MKKYILILLFSAMILLTGCSGKNIEDMVFDNKSCIVLDYERSQVTNELNKIQKKLEKIEKKNNYFHYSVVGTGSLISSIPIAIGSSYFYILPGFTILYYNKNVSYSIEEEHKKKLLEKLEKINKQRGEKYCNQLH